MTSGTDQEFRTVVTGIQVGGTCRPFRQVPVSFGSLGCYTYQDREWIPATADCHRRSWINFPKIRLVKVGQLSRGLWWFVESPGSTWEIIIIQLLHNRWFDEGSKNYGTILDIEGINSNKPSKTTGRQRQSQDSDKRSKTRTTEEIWRHI
jgi:hypothetical protein